MDTYLSESLARSRKVAWFGKIAMTAVALLYAEELVLLGISFVMEGITSEHPSFWWLYFLTVNVLMGTASLLLRSFMGGYVNGISPLSDKQSRRLGSVGVCYAGYVLADLLATPLSSYFPVEAPPFFNLSSFRVAGTVDLASITFAVFLICASSSLLYAVALKDDTDAIV